MIMPKKPLSLMNCHTSGGRSCRLWVMSQSSSIAHNCSTSLSRKACSRSLKPVFGIASSLLQRGRPLNSSPSHHTVPASSASCSVCDTCGNILRNTLRMKLLISRRRSQGTPSTSTMMASAR